MVQRVALWQHSSRKDGARQIGFLLSSVALATVTFCGQGLAQTAPPTANLQSRQSDLRDFDIAGQPLASALAAFNRQSGIQVSQQSSTMVNVTVNAVRGRMSAQAALSTMLSGTGISFRFTGNRAVVVGAGQSGNDASVAPDDGSTVLETITVAAGNGKATTGTGYQGTPDWVYETPSSLSVVGREAIQSAGTRNTRDLFNRISGVYAGEGNGSFPTVSPNIRGLQDSGRVIVSIDGARQNAQRGAGFGGSNYISNSGQAFVDSAFIRAVEVEKNTRAATGNAGSLGGKVEFQTVGADDLIADGKQWGVETNTGTGTNNTHYQGSYLAATRLGETPFSLTGGFSSSNLGEYAVGKNGDQTTTEDIMKNMLGRNNWSTLAKLEGDFGDVETSLSWMHQDNSFVYGTSGGGSLNRENARNDSVTAKFTWDPESPLIDMKGLLWLNDSNTKEVRERRTMGTPITTDDIPETTIDMGTKSFGASLDNTSVLETVAGPLTLNYGAEAFRDIATSSASSTSIFANPDWESSYTAFSPPGRRDTASLFVNGTLDPVDWVSLSAGLRYDWSRLKGTARYQNRVTTTVTTPARPAQATTTYSAWAQTYSPTTYNQRVSLCNGINPNTGLPLNNPSAQNTNCNLLAQLGEIVDSRFYAAGTTIPSTTSPPVTTYPEYEFEVDRIDSAWLPSATIEFKPADWFRPYVSYSESYRPPTILEAFFTGGPPTDNVGVAYAPNEDLRSETATTYEIGTNVSLDDVLTGGDSLRLKASAFYREVEDYIVLGTIYTSDVSTRTYQSFVNLDGTTRMKGVELEGNYDTGGFWIGGTASFLDTEWPSKTQVFSNGTTTTSGDIIATAGSVPPRLKLTVDGGMRFFDDRLSLGARLNHVTSNQSYRLDTDTGDLLKLTDVYTTVDIYGSFEVTEAATLRFSVNNVTDRNYIPANSDYTAPGRTFTATLKMKF
jgi:hemoglobin/transferrin/lactoferrin receptor protein